MKKFLLITFAFTLFSIGCAHKYSILKVNAASMKHRNLAAGSSLTNIGPVKAEYCVPIFEKTSGEDKGLIDEVIKVAQEKYRIDFILNPNFSHDGKCIYVDGEGAKINK